MRFGIVAAAGLAVWLVAGAARADEVLIGAQFPLSGPMASYSGPFLKQGTEIAVDRVNAEHLLGSGRTLKIDIEDNGGDRNQAISLMNRFGQSGDVMAVIGVYGSFLSLPAAPVANDLKIPLLAIAVSDAIPQAGPWSFTALAPPDVSMITLAKYAVDKLRVRNVAAAFDRANDASVRMKNSFVGYVKAHGVNVVSEDSFTAQDTNFGPIATKIAGESIDAFFFETVPATAGNLLIQVRQAGLDPAIRVMASGEVSSPNFFSIAGKAADGIYYPIDYDVDLQTDEARNFVAAYQKLYNKQPDQNAAWGYHATLLMAEAIRRAGPGADRAKIRDALAAIRGVPSVMGAGTFSFSDGRTADYPSEMVQYKDGKVQHLAQ